MFFRESYSKKYPTPILQLIESVRTEKGVRNRLIVSLGRMQIAKPLRRKVAVRVEQLLLGQQSLLKEKPQIEKLSQLVVEAIRIQGKWDKSQRVHKIKIAEPAKDAETKEKNKGIERVFIDQVQHTQTRELGPVFSGLKIMEELEFDQILKSLHFNQNQIKAAKISIINRLASPGSEHNMPLWLKTTALPDLLDIKPETYNMHSFYNISDKLIEHKEKIERQLAQKEQNLFNLKRSIYLYDLSNTYFEGLQKENKKAKYSKNSKEKRTDCLQVGIGLVVDENGFAIRHQTFDGNIGDSKTLPEVINSLRVDKEQKEQTVIVDAGISCDKNLRCINKMDMHYLVAIKRPKREQYSHIFKQENLFKVIAERKDKPEVKIYKSLQKRIIQSNSFVDEKNNLTEKQSQQIHTDLKKKGYITKENTVSNKYKIEKQKRNIFVNSAYQSYEEDIMAILDWGLKEDVYLFCKSEKRAQKEIAIKQKVKEKLEIALEKLSKRIQNGRLIQNEKINQAIGKIKATHSRIARFYEITYNIQEKKLRWEQTLAIEQPGIDGNYIIRTDRKDLTGQEIWETYMTLLNVEQGFKDLKSHLGLRPNYHFVERRVDGHIFITLLAYHILHAIRTKLIRLNDYRTWPTIKQILKTHQYTTMILPTVSGGVINLRKASNPDSDQQEIYKRLNIKYQNLPIKKMEI